MTMMAKSDAERREEEIVRRLREINEAMPALRSGPAGECKAVCSRVTKLLGEIASLRAEDEKARE
jgi:hypothetical protein